MRAVMLRTAASAPTAMVAHHRAAPQQRSPWHSPVPYLFGGLAAMLGLIAFALLLLACSYWKISGYLEGGNGGEDGSGDLDSGGEGKPGDASACKPPEQRIVVIMAGDDRPTFLATPKSSRAFGGNFNNGNGSDEDNSMGDEKKAETKAGGGDAQSHERQEEGTHENPDEMVTQQSQNQRQDLEDTHQRLDRDQ